MLVIVFVPINVCLCRRMMKDFGILRLTSRIAPIVNIVRKSVLNSPV